MPWGLSCALEDIQWRPWPPLTRRQSHLPPTVTTNNVSQHCQMSPGGYGVGISSPLRTNEPELPQQNQGLRKVCTGGRVDKMALHKSTALNHCSVLSMSLTMMITLFLNLSLLWEPLPAFPLLLSLLSSLAKENCNSQRKSLTCSWSLVPTPGVGSHQHWPH